MAEVAKNPVAESVAPSGNVIEDMISNLITDIESRNEYYDIKEEAVEFISDADDRIDGASKALSFMTDFLTEDQIKTIEGLNLRHVDIEPPEVRKTLNEVAQIAFDALKKAKGNQMTNEALHEAYKEQVDEYPLNYSKFNVKIRSLFSNQTLIREIPEGVTNTREHIIKINGFKAGK